MSKLVGRALAALTICALCLGGALAQDDAPAGEILPPPAPDPTLDAIASPRAAPTTAIDASTPPPFEPSRADAVLTGFVDGAVAAHRREHATPGVVVSVVRDGRVVLAKGYGVAGAGGDKPASGRETLFRIGSVSKTFVWTAAMMLADRGALDLDADVNGYLKEVRVPEAFGAPVTMNHLMAHRAGFEDAFGVYTHGDDERILDAAILQADMPARVFPPGARTSYSNYGSALAAKVVEDVAGVPFALFLEEEILAPLAMTRTTLAAPSAMDDRFAKATSAAFKVKARAPSTMDYLQLGAYAPAGAMATTAGDMARWMLLHLGGGAHDGVRLLSPTAHAALFSRAFDDRAGPDLAHGFFQSTHRGVELFGHGGATTGFLSSFAVAPSLDVGVFVAQNAAGDGALTRQLVDIVIDHALGDAPGTPLAPVAAADVDLGPYAGSFLNNRRSFTRFEKFMALPNVVRVSKTDDGARVLTTARGAARLTPLGGDACVDPDGKRIVFGREGGRVTHFVGAGGVHSYERVGFSTDPALFFAALGAAAFFAATTWLGAWRRIGRGGPAPGTTAPGTPARIAGLGALAGAAIVFAFLAALGAVAAAYGDVGPTTFLAYPSASIHALRLAAIAVCLAALGLVASLWFAWRSPAWGVWRKLHHTALASSLVAFAVALVVWKVAFAATA
ncbi:MAG: serine hydrolase domain-containing protein [Parvularculaceae bacterium]